MNRCPIISCALKLRDEKYLMCRHHWEMVPEVLQKLIWRLWNAGKPLDGHHEACQSAIDQVNTMIAERDGPALDPATHWPFKRGEG